MAKVIHTHERLGKQKKFPVSYVRTIKTIREDMEAVAARAEDPSFPLSLDDVDRWLSHLLKMDLESYIKPKLISNEKALKKRDA